MMPQEIITGPNTDDEKDIQNCAKNSIYLSNVIATPDHDEQSDHRKIFAESCEPCRSADGFDARDERHNLGDDMHDNKRKICECETMLLAKPAGDTDQELYENENSMSNTDDEETVLLNGIANILVTRGASYQNERAKMSCESKSSNEARDEQRKNPKIKSKKKLILATVDAFFSVVVLAPIVVIYWKGLWELMDVYHETFSAHRSLFFGVGGHVIFAILKHHFHANFARELKAEYMLTRLGYRLIRISYTYVFSACCIMNWRGAWIIFDDFTTTHEWFLRFVTVACIVILILLRSVRNLIAAPYVVAIDKRGYVFRFPTRFDVNTRDWFLYILDCAFSVGVVGTLVVFVWRGVWVIFDLYLFPDNAEYSAVGSIVIGYTIVVITFSLQPLMRYTCTRLKGLPRLAAVDIFLLLSFTGTVNVWRGVWNVLGLWFLPEDPELSCWITHLGCFTFLVLLNCSNSILVRGVYIDAEEAEGKCAVFPCHYIRLFFKIEREKKEARRQNLAVASRDLATITERTEKEENGALMNTSNSAIVTETPESLV